MAEAIDRHELWASLDMDLETHDVLCSVLPQAFGDVYLSQDNRPEGMAFWDMVVADVHGIRPQELVDAQAEGKKVFGTFCTYVPDEVVIACDGIVTGLCGGSQFWVPEGEKYLPADMCPLIKASLGARFGKTCPFFRIVDQVVGETTCDGKKKMYEIMAEGERGTAKTTAVRALPAILGQDVRVVELPLNATEDRVVGTLNVGTLMKSGELEFVSGVLAEADGNILYVDEINLLEDHIVDLLLDAAATGECHIEREGVSKTYPARFVRSSPTKNRLGQHVLKTHANATRR